jgi:hypothetical protein
MKNSPCILVDDVISDEDIAVFPEILAYGSGQHEGTFAQHHSGYPLPGSVCLLVV